MYVLYLSPSLLYTFKTFSNQTQSSFSICFTIVWERATFVHTTTNMEIAITSLFTSYNKCDQQVDNSCKRWKYFKTYLTWIAGSSMISHSIHFYISTFHKLWHNCLVGFLLLRFIFKPLQQYRQGSMSVLFIIFTVDVHYSPDSFTQWSSTK